MTITPVKNIGFINDVFVCPESPGIMVSEFHMDFDDPVSYLDKDHCECIHVQPFVNGNKLELTVVSDKNDIDEFIILMLKIGSCKTNLKIRFKRG